MTTIAEDVQVSGAADMQVDERSEVRDEAVECAVLRLLSGPLRGCEYALAEGRTLVVVGAPSELVGQGEHVDFPERTIVLPMEGAGNFEILIYADARSDYRLRTLHPQLEERTQAFQQVCRVGSLDFVVRPAGSEWEPDIVEAKGRTDAAVAKSRRQIRLLTVLAGFVALVVLLVAGLTYWAHVQGERRVADVAAVVAGASSQYRLLKGRGDLIHLFAQNERDALWARQALTREGMAASAQVATLWGEEQRVSKLLQENYPAVAFHRLKLDDPARPMLILSWERTRLNKQVRQSLQGSLLGWMPYAQGVDMLNWSDELVDDQARSGLDRLGISYQRHSNVGSVTYVIASELSDVDLARLQQFTEVFYRDYGHRYVHFSVVLKDEKFKDKSFKYGGSAYFKLAQQHWFFPHMF
jgi:type III secretion system PrgH/EprH family protein